MTRNGSRLIGGGIIVALLTLLAVFHSITFAHNQNGQDPHTIVSLWHTPHGTADLKWNPQATTLTVTIKLSGLQAQTVVIQLIFIRVTAQPMGLLSIHSILLSQTQLEMGYQQQPSTTLLAVYLQLVGTLMFIVAQPYKHQQRRLRYPAAMLSINIQRQT